MNLTTFIRLLRMLLLLAIQVVLLNRIHLMGYVTPLLIGYMVVCLHQDTSRITALLWAFATGLLFDIFSDTAGMASASMTLIAMLQPPLLRMFTPRDAPERMVPTFRTIGTFSYIAYTVILMFVLHTTFYLLDSFSILDWQLTLLCIGGGTLLCTVLSLMTELLVRSRKS